MTFSGFMYFGVALKLIRLFQIAGKYDCQLCGKTFKTDNKLRLHKYINHSGKVYHCDKCEYKTTNPSNVQSHRRIHNENRHFECEICKKKTTTRLRMKIHKRIHTGERLIFGKSEQFERYFLLQAKSPTVVQFVASPSQIRAHLESTKNAMIHQSRLPPPPTSRRSKRNSRLHNNSSNTRYHYQFPTECPQIFQCRYNR
jgi:Zinc finger, C2H2 type/Zinc-finger of C2H2 type